MIELLHPVFLYSYFREKAYSFGVKSRTQLNVPVVSVGNLQFGGSGKTPFVMYLLERFKKHKIAVVSQSYKANLKNPERVDLTKPNFQKIYGDEPTLIKSKFPTVDVWCGPVKWETAKVASEFTKYDLLILDDGYTHHQLSREVNLLLMDGSRALKSFRLPPLGLLRERFSACSRADAVIVTKVNDLKANSSLVEKIKIFNRRIGWAKYASHLNSLPAQGYFLFAGIGNFDFFLKNAKDLGLSIQSFEQFENHFDYSDDQQRLILEKLKKSNLRGLTTLKDLVKITNSELLGLLDHLSGRYYSRQKYGAMA